MKKLISAASALAMAASMVGAVVPFTTGAIDETKGFELRPFVNKAGENVSTKISEADIAAGDVTIPVGVYLTEKTADISFISAQWSVDSKDGDASNSNVTFTGYAPNKEYFTENQAVKSNDKTFNTNRIVGFCGTLKTGSSGVTGFSDLSKRSMYSIEGKQEKWGIENAWGSVVWDRPVKQDSYEYTGEASDSFPMFVFEVTFAKGTPAGTYTIDFVNKEKAGAFATYIEACVPQKTYNIPDGSLTVKGLDIVIGDSASAGTTTAGNSAGTTVAKPVGTTTAGKPVETKPAGTTTPSGGDLSENFEIADDFTVSMKQDYEVKPGDTVMVQFVVSNPNNHLGSTFAVEMGDLPAGITAEMTDMTCLAVDPDGITDYYEFIGGKSYQANVVDESSTPVPITDGEVIAQYELTIPDDIKPGEYEVGLQKFRVIEFASEKAGPEISKFDAKLVGGKIIVKGESAGTTTAGKPVATTTAGKPVATTTAGTTPVTTAGATKPATTPATTATPTGKPLYGDTNDDGEVNIADVVLLNKWLNNNADYAMTEKGKLNADCCDEKGGKGLDKNDSDAIIRSIVHLIELPCTAADIK